MNKLVYILYLYIWDKSHEKPSEKGHFFFHDVDFFVNFLIILFVWVFWLHSCLYTICMPDAGSGQKGASDPQELQLQTAGRCNAGVRNRIWVLWKRSKQS